MEQHTEYLDVLVETLTALEDRYFRRMDSREAVDDRYAARYYEGRTDAYTDALDMLTDPEHLEFLHTLFCKDATNHERSW